MLLNFQLGLIIGILISIAYLLIKIEDKLPKE